MATLRELLELLVEELPDVTGEGPAARRERALDTDVWVSDADGAWGHEPEPELLAGALFLGPGPACVSVLDLWEATADGPA